MGSFQAVEHKYADMAVAVGAAQVAVALRGRGRRGVLPARGDGEGVGGRMPESGCGAEHPDPRR
ncbi:hypothetical protein ACWCPQ_02770 [Nocardia sp. NPDC001965]